MSEMYTVSSADIDARVSFIRKTYAHLLGAVLLFIALEVALFTSGAAVMMAEAMMGVSWMLVLMVFMGIGYVANKFAMKETSPAMQYLGLGLCVVAEAIIFIPLLFQAATYSDPTVIPLAGITTATVFAGLTVTVFATKKDFSFMRAGLGIASFLAIGAIFGSLIFGFSLGLFFSIAMAALASGYVLYYTSNVLHHYRPGQHVAASLALFSAVALLFYYILRIFMSRR